MKFIAKKSLGQNFLQNPKIVERMVKTAGLNGSQFVVEIGPGYGALTASLLKNAKKVLAIEKDARLFEGLKEKFKDAKNFELISADALKTPPPKEPYLLAANIPYYITSPLLNHFIKDNGGIRPSVAVLMVQKEVAKKICEKPPRMNVLALHVQTFGMPKIEFFVSKNNFYPQPKVDSAVIKIDLDKKPHFPPLFSFDRYFELIHTAFSHKRKMLRSVFDTAVLEKTGIDPKRRPETLSIAEWQKLTAI